MKYTVTNAEGKVIVYVGFKRFDINTPIEGPLMVAVFWIEGENHWWIVDGKDGLAELKRYNLEVMQSPDSWTAYALFTPIREVI